MEIVKDRKDCGSGSSNKIDKMNTSLCAWTLHDNLKPWLKGMLLNWFFTFFFSFFSQLIDLPSSQQKCRVIWGKLPLFNFYLLSFMGMFWRSSWLLACRKFAFSGVIGPKIWQKPVVSEMILLISDTAYALLQNPLKLEAMEIKSLVKNRKVLHQNLLLMLGFCVIDGQVWTWKCTLSSDL